MSSALGPASRLLQYLPAVYQEPKPGPPPEGAQQPARSLAEAKEPVYQAPYLDSYLLPYEEILLGLPGIDSLHVQGGIEDLPGLPGTESWYTRGGTEEMPGRSGTESWYTPGATENLPGQPGTESLHTRGGAEDLPGQPGAESLQASRGGTEGQLGLSGKGSMHARAGTKDLLGLESLIAALHRLIDPWKTPEEFLPWLAQWAALTLATGLPAEIHRKLLANIIPLYRIRGTKSYLEQLLSIYLRVPADVIDDLPAMQVARHATIGRDSWVGGGPPHFFRVILRFSLAAGSELERQRRLARYVIELAKPAHTDYILEVSAPRFQIGVHSTVAMDSFL